MEYGLIGEHLGHSFSPEIHKKIGNYKYELRELAPDELDGFLTKRDFKAINVTIPYKTAVIPYLYEISPEAQKIGAVNCIVNRDGKLYGYNTDFAGMRSNILHKGIEVSGKKVLILGTGGTSKTAHAVAESLGASEILTVSRGGKDGVITYQQAIQDHSDAEIIINTTPAGMFPDVSGKPIDLSAFTKVRGVMDAIFNPLRTELVLDAEERGIPASGGLYMLVAQAVHGAACFFGEEPDESKIERIYREILAEKQNLVLIGMSGSGKSAVGQALSRLTGREVIDTDSEIIKKAGMSINEIFAKMGQEKFRDMETEAVSEAAEKNGVIISTGGGAVLRPQNVRFLKKNGCLCFLDRDPEKLVYSDDRPLAGTREQAIKLYHERFAIYTHAADMTVKNDASLDDVVKRVAERADL